jgi:Holliday junction DNA helicase RuvA
MYEYIKGALVEATLTKATIDVNGLGYSLWIPFNNYAKLPQLGSPTTLYVSFVVREDSQRLYGFLTRHERDLFESLIEVSGIGKKTAERLIIEMRDKIKKGIDKSLLPSQTDGSQREQGVIADAISALINLGYNSAQAQKAIKTATGKIQGDPELAKLITAALRCI